MSATTTATIRKIYRCMEHDLDVALEAVDRMQGKWTKPLRQSRLMVSPNTPAHLLRISCEALVKHVKRLRQLRDVGSF